MSDQRLKPDLGAKSRSFLFLVLITTAFRFPSLLLSFWDEDESIYLSFVRAVNAGGHYYRNAVDLKPPFVFDWYLLASRLIDVFGFGASPMVGVHLLTFLWIAGTAWTLNQIECRISNAVRPVSGLIYVAFSASVRHGLATNCELIMNLPIVLSLWAIFNRATLRAGFFLGAAALVKYQALAFLPAYAFVRKKGVLANLGLLLVGVSVVFLLRTAPIIAQGAWPDFVKWGIFYNWEFHRSASFDFSRRAFGQNAIGVLVCWSPLIFLIAFARIQEQRAITLALAASTLGVTVGGKFFPHYFLAMLPMISLLASQGVGLWAPARARMVVSALLLIGLAETTILAAHEYPRQFKEEASFRALGNRINQLTNPQDRIQIWGRASEVYAFADRSPSSRFFTSNFLVGMNTYNYAERLDQERAQTAWARESAAFFEDLTQNPPELWIDTSVGNLRNFGQYPVRSFERLDQMVQARYRLIETLNGTAIYQKKRP